MKYLVRQGDEKLRSDGVLCVALAHNEQRILPDFLAHYRSLGSISFLIVDDSSTDGTADILRSQPDVSLFRPAPGTTFASHMQVWRSSLLDQYATNRWCLLPDIDEHFVYSGMEYRDLSCFIEDLEKEGSNAVFAIMIDMYDDRPLAEHEYGGGGCMADSFPYFDGPAARPHGYFLVKRNRRSLLQYPTPLYQAHGGIRHRVFFSSGHPWEPVTTRLIQRQCQISQVWPSSRNITLQSSVLRKAMRRTGFGSPNIAKIPFVKWPGGARFKRAVHLIDRQLQLSRELTVLLHFPFARGLDGFKYISTRGAHSGSARIHRDMLEDPDRWNSSPILPDSCRYTSSGGILKLFDNSDQPERTSLRSHSRST